MCIVGIVTLWVSQFFNVKELILQKFNQKGVPNFELWWDCFFWLPCFERHRSWSRQNHCYNFSQPLIVIMSIIMKPWERKKEKKKANAQCWIWEWQIAIQLVPRWTSRGHQVCAVCMCNTRTIYIFGHSHQVARIIKSPQADHLIQLQGQFTVQSVPSAVRCSTRSRYYYPFWRH